MAKNYKKQLQALTIDLKDKKILFEMDLNARQSFSKIAKKVGLSKEVVNYRAKNLVDIGVIKSFYTVIDVSRLGYLSFRLFLKLQGTTLEKEEEIINYLKSNPSVGWMVSCQGGWDINLIYWTKSLHAFETFMDALLEKYWKYLGKKWVSIFTKICHYRRAYILGKEDKGEVEIVGGGKLEKIDELDYFILKIIANNARMPVLEISKKLKCSARLVTARIKNMEKKEIIQGYRPLLDLPLLGYEYYKVHIQLQNISKQRLKDLTEYARLHPNIVYVDKLIGGADFEMEIQAQNNNEFRKIMEEIRHIFFDIIQNYESLLYYKEHKFSYLPTSK